MRRRALLLVVGLTGDVGAGKSTLSNIWADEGAHVVNADAVVAELWKTEELISLAASRWGGEILSEDGTPDHAAISRIIFADEIEYRWLCDVIHPKVREIMAEKVRCLDGWVVAEIPLLFENGVPEWVDLTVYVHAAMDLRLSRNSARGWGPEEIEKRERWLFEGVKKQNMADFVLANNGSPGMLECEARNLACGFLAASSIIRISINAFSVDEARNFRDTVYESGLVPEVRISDTGSLVTAFARQDSIERVSALIGRIHAGEGLQISVSKCVSVPKHILLWAMEGTES